MQCNDLNALRMKSSSNLTHMTAPHAKASATATSNNAMAPIPSMNGLNLNAVKNSKRRLDFNA